MPSKQIVKDIKTHFQKVLDDATSYEQKITKIDRQLTTKIKKISEVSKEIIDYINKRSDNK